MQVISMHWTSTIIIYLELGLSKSPSAQVKTMTNDPYPVSVKAHVENVFFQCQYNKEEMKRRVAWAECYLFLLLKKCKDASILSTNKQTKIFVYGSGFSPPALAKLAWFIIVFFLIKMVNTVLQTLI